MPFLDHRLDRPGLLKLLDDRIEFGFEIIWGAKVLFYISNNIDNLIALKVGRRQELLPRTILPPFLIARSR